MDVAALALFAPVKKAIDIYRYLLTGSERQWKDAAVVLGSWVLGVGLVALVAGSTFVADLGLTLETWQDYVLTGITLGSLAGVTADIAQPAGVVVE